MATEFPTRTVVLDEPLTEGVAPFRTDMDGSRDFARGLREFTSSGSVDELSVEIGDLDASGPCGIESGIRSCRSALALTVLSVDGDTVLSVRDSGVRDVTLEEWKTPTHTDGGPIPTRVVTATSESVTGTIAIRRVTSGEDGIEDDGVDLDLDLTFHMSDGRDRHIVMTVSWRFVFECLR